MKLISIAVLMLFFGTANVLLAMLAGAPAWITFIAFVLGIIAALCVAVIVGDMDGTEKSRERKPTKAKVELIIETRKEYDELEGPETRSVVLYR